MEVQTESIYVVRMTRLEAAKVLAEPAAMRDLQIKLRERLSTTETEEVFVDGETITRALPATAGSGNGSPKSPTVKKLMQRFAKGSRRVKCPQCEKMVKPGIGLGIHLARMHGVRGASAEAAS